MSAHDSLAPPLQPLPPERRLRFEAALSSQHGLSLDGATPLGAGFGSVALLLADRRTVARIPRYEWAAHDLGYEVRVLQVLAGARLPVEIPNEARTVEDVQGIAGTLHRLVQGWPLKERLGALGDEGRRALARDLGAFLGALHALPPDDFPDLKVDPWPEQFHVRGRAALPLLDERGRAWLDARLAAIEVLARPPGAPLVFTHGDLWGSNLLLDDSDRLRGVIDFGLASAADPAWDLRSLVELFGRDFTAEALAHYPHRLDGNAIERAKVYCDLDEVGDLYYELTVLGAPGRSLEQLRRRVAGWDGRA